MLARRFVRSFSSSSSSSSPSVSIYHCLRLSHCYSSFVGSHNIVHRSSPTAASSLLRVRVSTTTVATVVSSSVFSLCFDSRASSLLRQLATVASNSDSSPSSAFASASASASAPAVDGFVTSVGPTSSNASVSPPAALTASANSIVYPSRLNEPNSTGGGDLQRFYPQSHSQTDTGRLVQDVPLDSIIKIFSVTSSPNYIQPWTNKPLKEVTGSGFAIKGRRVLTNAHVVADQKFVMVKKQGNAIKFQAKVEAVGHECDLAVLTIEDSRFWDGLEELEFATVPDLQEHVTVVGYPIGGDTLSVTRGVVSRVEPQQYAHGASKLLAIQIDAAINPGNSGGPALMGNKVAGVAFQNLSGAENIGFIIPVPIIQHFLTDIQKNKQYVGFCDLGITCQALENPHFQSIMKLDPAQLNHGVVINLVFKCSPAFGVLRKFDVLSAIDGHPIACDGTVLFRGRERIMFDYLLSQKFAGDVCKLDIIRDGQKMQVEVVLNPVHHLVPVFQYDIMPSWLIFGGLVFVPLTQSYLHEYGYDWYNTSPRRLCHLALNGRRQYADQQVVILSQVLMHEVNVGYQRMIDTVIKKVNGVEIRNLAHLSQLLDLFTNQRSTFAIPTPSSAPQPIYEDLELNFSQPKYQHQQASSFSNSPSFSSDSGSDSFSSTLMSASPSSSVSSSHSASGGGAVESVESSAESLQISTLLMNAGSGTIVFETDDHRLIVMDGGRATVAEKEILERHRIPSSRSSDLCQLLPAGSSRA